MYSQLARAKFFSRVKGNSLRTLPTCGILFNMESPLGDKLSPIEARIRELPKLIEAEPNPIKVETLARELRQLLSVDDKSEPTDG